MTGKSRCQARRKMMGRGADGGCGTEEKPCPVSKLTPAAKTPAPEKSPENPEKLEEVHLGVDLYSQAFKALSERSPFDSDEVLANTIPTLPSELAGLLSKHSDSKKKHKRPHSDTKSSRKGSTQKSKTSNTWVELEDYFRELTLQDIETLHRFSSLFRILSSSSNSCFTIPALGNALRNNNSNKVEDGLADIVPVVAKEEELLGADVGVSDCGAFEVEEPETENAKQQHVRIDDGSRESIGIADEVPLAQCSSESCSSAEWVLGSRNRVLLSTMRPTKKRKLLGETAGLERLIVAQPCEGSLSLCHVCSMGDIGDQLNQLVVCKSCNVVVHQKCYGVQGEIDRSWLCSWCKHKIDAQAGHTSGSDRPCVLCSKLGGALKRFQSAGAGNGGNAVEFAHLFCCQWMPEVYIDHTRLMEPVLSRGIKDVRGKLVCNLCKVKHGYCVRCSDGSCRTSFHPICAREARNKLEIWGKFGCDDIELRAFCAKHSGGDSVAASGTLENKEQNHAIGCDSLGSSSQPAVLSVNKIKKLKIGCRNGDKGTFHRGVADTNSNSLVEKKWQEIGLKDDNSNTKLKSGSGDGQELLDVEPLERNSSEDVKASSFLDLGEVLKKLMGRAKVNLEQIAAGIGISEDSLASRLTDNYVGPELNCKILKWIRDHAHLDSSEKDSRAKLRRLMLSNTKLGTDDGSDAVAVRDLDMADVPVKSVPPRRRTVGDIRILKDDKVISLCYDNLLGNGVSMNEGNKQEHVNGDHDNSIKDSILNDMAEIMVETNGFERPSAESSPTCESLLLKSNILCDVERNGAKEGTSSGKSSLLDVDQEFPSCSSANTVGYCDGDIEPGTDFSVHPYIQKKLEEARSWFVQPDLNECMEHKSCAMEQSPSADVCCNHKKLPVCIDEGNRSNGVKLEDLQKAKEMGILDLYPENEVEGAIIYFQQRLLDNAFALKCRTDQLVGKIVRNLPHEIDAARKRRWDEVLVNQYIHDLKEARKQGRKERRHKEAQAVLAAATAAAAASSRISSLRKDVVDECPQLENRLKLERTRARGSPLSLSVPHAKESNSSLDVPKAISDRNPAMFQFTSGSPKEHPRLCDICRRSESVLNPILVCSSCKVAVHLNCYLSVKESAGPWYCELCEESSLLKVPRATLGNSWERPYSSAECGLCGASSGAFRKSSNGQWIHAFCAEWVFDSTFRRGQVYPVAGMETVLKENDVCSVCHRRCGVCIKCNYGNCQATFHPFCARSAGYYMYTRYIGGGKRLHKAYCSKHSSEQREKVETQKHGVEDLKIVKLHRVELEKLRLLCERIVKREKLKRELVLCNHDILASKRDSVAFSILVRRPFSSHGSSDSATTSLGGHVDGSGSCSEAMQRSDDITVDSALSAKHCIRHPMSIDNDQKTEDSSTSHHLIPKPRDRVSCAGKQIPIRAAMATHHFLPRKHTETFEKELVMTSDQACMKNRRLPKGYIYVPIDCLSNGKSVSHDSVEREEVDE